MRLSVACSWIQVSCRARSLGVVKSPTWLRVILIKHPILTGNRSVACVNQCKSWSHLKKRGSLNRNRNASLFRNSLKTLKFFAVATTTPVPWLTESKKSNRNSTRTLWIGGTAPLCQLVSRLKWGIMLGSIPLTMILIKLELSKVKKLPYGLLWSYLKALINLNNKNFNKSLIKPRNRITITISSTVQLLHQAIINMAKVKFSRTTMIMIQQTAVLITP